MTPRVRASSRVAERRGTERRPRRARARGAAVRLSRARHRRGQAARSRSAAACFRRRSPRPLPAPKPPASTASSCTTRTPTRWRGFSRPATTGATATAARATSASGCRSRCSRQSARASVHGFVVGCRFLTDEIVAGGSRLDDAIYFAVAFARAGLDFLSLSRGGKFEDAKQPEVGEAAYPYTGESGWECMPTIFADARGPFGRNIDDVAAVRRAVRDAGFDTPIVATGGIHAFEQAEAILVRRRRRHRRRRAADAGRSGLVPQDPPRSRAATCGAARSPITARRSISAIVRSRASSGIEPRSTIRPCGARPTASGGSSRLAPSGRVIPTERGGWTRRERTVLHFALGDIGADRLDFNDSCSARGCRPLHDFRTRRLAALECLPRRPYGARHRRRARRRRSDRRAAGRATARQ